MPLRKGWATMNSSKKMKPKAVAKASSSKSSSTSQKAKTQKKPQVSGKSAKAQIKSSENEAPAAKTPAKPDPKATPAPLNKDKSEDKKPQPKAKPVAVAKPAPAKPESSSEESSDESSSDEEPPKEVAMKTPVKSTPVESAESSDDSDESDVEPASTKFAPTPAKKAQKESSSEEDSSDESDEDPAPSKTPVAKTPAEKVQSSSEEDEDESEDDDDEYETEDEEEPEPKGVKRKNKDDVARIPTKASKSSDINLKSEKVASDPYKTLDKQGIAVPISDFAQLRRNEYFVDKSLMIEALMKGEYLTLITAPRQMGKSTMLSTLKYFFEIQVDPKDGKSITKIDLSSAEIITGTTNYDLFNGLKISQSSRKELGKWPVIFVDLQTSRPVTSVETAVDIVRYAIHKCYEQHSYLMKSEKLTHSAKRLVADWCDEEIFKSKDSFNIGRSLAQLSEILHEQWGKNCIVLVDDYDSILMNALGCESVGTTQLDSMVSLVATLLFYVGEADYIERMLVTGTTDAAGISSSMCFKKYLFLEDHRYTEFFGLLESEVKELLKKSNTQIPYEDVSLYYNGYTTTRGQSIYNTWSIMNFLEYQRLEPYWCRAGITVGLYASFNNEEMRTQIGDLIRGGTIHVHADRNLFRNEFKQIKKVLTSPIGINKPLMFLFFLDQGYLSLAEPENANTSEMPYNCHKALKLKMPNTEIREHLQLALDAYYEAYLSPWEAECAETRNKFELICKCSESKDKSYVLKDYLNALKRFASKGFSKQYTISHVDLYGLVVCAAKRLCPTYRSDMEILEKIRIENGERVDFCAVCYDGWRKTVIIMKLEINENKIETVKDRLLNGHYISAFNDRNLKIFWKAIIIGLNLIQPVNFKESSRKLKFEMIYTEHTLDEKKKNTNLHNNKWKILKCPSE